KAVAKRLGTSVRAIENWTRQKKHPLPYIRHCGHPKYRESDIQWWLSQGCSVAARRAAVFAQEAGNLGATAPIPANFYRTHPRQDPEAGNTSPEAPPPKRK